MARQLLSLGARGWGLGARGRRASNQGLRRERSAERFQELRTSEKS